MAEVVMSYDPLDFALGTAFAVLFYAVLKIDEIARLLAVLLVLSIIWAVFIAPGGAAAVVESAVSKLGRYASSGFLAGVAIGKMVLTIFESLQRAQRKPLKSRRRRK